MRSERRYLLICLKRSDYPKHKVYWRDNQCGYTDKLEEAGYYKAEELHLCHGKRGDWIIEPIWIPVDYNKEA